MHHAVLYLARQYDLNRRYGEVWSEPMQKYNLSEVCLAKICKKLKIPLPVAVIGPKRQLENFGRRNLQALHGHHPGKPSGFKVRRIVGAGDLWVTELVINYKEKRFETVSIMEFQDGTVIHETQYFAEPFDAPAWRSQWVEHAT